MIVERHYGRCVLENCQLRTNDQNETVDPATTRRILIVWRCSGEFYRGSSDTAMRRVKQIYESVAEHFLGLPGDLSASMHRDKCLIRISQRVSRTFRHCSTSRRISITNVVGAVVKKRFLFAYLAQVFKMLSISLYTSGSFISACAGWRDWQLSLMFVWWRGRMC